MSKECALCGTKIYGSQYNKRFCSAYCQRKRWAAHNKERRLILQREWRKNNPDKVEADAKSDTHKKAVAKWKNHNLKKHIDYNNNYCVKRKTYDSSFKISCNIRSRISKAVKNNYKSGSAVKDLGCSIDELKKYLEDQFQPGMTWDNYGHKGWHIDHIKPLSSFNLTNKKEFKKACHYSNLQPLWAKDNLIKGAKND